MLNSFISRSFRKKFNETFRKRKPDWKSNVKPIFLWLQMRAKTARYFHQLDELEKLATRTYEHFSKFEDLEKNVTEEYHRTLEEIKKRDESLRTVREREKGKISIISGEKEKERIPPEE